MTISLLLYILSTVGDKVIFFHAQRLNFLEALEAEFDNRNRLNNVLQLQREFNE